MVFQRMRGGLTVKMLLGVFTVSLCVDLKVGEERGRFTHSGTRGLHPITQEFHINRYPSPTRPRRVCTVSRGYMRIFPTWFSLSPIKMVRHEKEIVRLRNQSSDFTRIVRS